MVDDLCEVWLDAGMTTNSDYTLHDYETDTIIREATLAEMLECLDAAKKDDGAGIIVVDDQGERRCYVSGDLQYGDILSMLGTEIDSMCASRPLKPSGFNWEAHLAKYADDVTDDDTAFTAAVAALKAWDAK